MYNCFGNFGENILVVKTQSGNEAVETCMIKGIHRDILSAVRKKMPHSVSVYELADLFKLFGDSTRLGIIWALSESEMCVCDLSEILGVSQSAVSHQLKTLRQANLVAFRREGKTAIYRLKDEHVKQIIKIGMEHISEK